MDIVDAILQGNVNKNRFKSKAIEFTVQNDLCEVLDDLNTKANGGPKSRIKSQVVNQALRFYFEHKGLLKKEEPIDDTGEV